MFYAEPAPAATRALSPRQLPTDHGHAVPTREYQSDQSSRQLLRCHRPCCPKPKRTLKAHQRERVPTYAARRCFVDARTVLTVQGSLRRAKLRRALDGSAPFRDGDCDGRLRREHFTGCSRKRKGRLSSSEESRSDSEITVSDTSSP